MSLEISKEQREQLKNSLRRFCAEKLEEDLSEMHAGFLLDYICTEITPLAYNRGVEAAQTHFRRALEDLPGACFEEPLTYWQHSARNVSRDVRRKPSR